MTIDNVFAMLNASRVEEIQNIFKGAGHNDLDSLFNFNFNFIILSIIIFTILFTD